MPIAPVAEHVLVDRLRPVPEAVDERLADQVAIRSLRTVGDGNADPAVLADAGFLLRLSVLPLAPDRIGVVRREEEILLPVLLLRIRRPHRALRPLDLIGRQDLRMLRPRPEVLRREDVHKRLFPESCE